MVNKSFGEKHLACGHRPGKDDGSVSVDTFRIYDACRQQDCLEDLLVLLTEEGQRLVDNASAVRIRSARVLWARIDTEEMPFHQGYFRVNIRYYFHCVLECSNGIGTGQETAGLTVYDRSMMLYGGSSRVSSFASDLGADNGRILGGIHSSINHPRIVVEAAEPVALRLTTVDFDRSRTFGASFCESGDVPEEIAAEFPGRFMNAVPGNKVLFVTLGLFSMVRIERPAQLIVPACDSSVPTGCGEYRFGDTDPCTLFRAMEFPLAEFYPETVPEPEAEPVLPLETQDNG